MLSIMLLCSGIAQGLSQRGHVFSPSATFGAEGACQLAQPGAVAVNEATGEIFVVERATDKVDIFNSEGKCVSSFKVGPKSEGGLGGIAVDNSPGSPSFGDVYVAGPREKESTEANTIYKVNPKELNPKTNEPEVVQRIHTFKVEGATEEFLQTKGLAVDAGGGLWVREEGTIFGFSGGLPSKFQTTVPVGLPCATVDEAFAGFAVGPHAEAFYVGHFPEEATVEACLEGTEGQAVIGTLDKTGHLVTQALDHSNSSSVAVDLKAGAAYIDHLTFVSAFDSTGSLIERFGDQGELAAGTGIAVDAATNIVYVPDGHEHKVEVFEPAPPGPPVIDSESAQNLTPTAARLSAEIDPNGAETSYVFQYGTVNCKENPAVCTETAVKQLPAEFGDQLVQLDVTGLQPSTDYFYRVLATNTVKGKTVTAEGVPSVNTFTTMPSPIGVLADNRQWELVSPPNKGGASLYPITFEGGLIQSSEDGQAISYIADAPLTPTTEGNRAFEVQQVLSRRVANNSSTPNEWSTKDITTPNERGEGIHPQFPPEYQFFSPDLSTAIVEPQPREEATERPPLSANASERTPYRRNGSECTPSAGCFEPLVTAANTAGHPFGGKVQFTAATPDVRHAIVESSVALTNQPVAEINLFEWQGGQLELVSLLPEEGGKPGVAAPEAELGDNGRNVRNAISRDGSRVFWSGSAPPVGAPHLYMRDAVKHETIQIDAPEQGVEAPENDEPRFQIANANGSMVFFTASARISKESHQPKNGAGGAAGFDLYVCEIVEDPSTKKLGCKLTDLTVAGFGERAGVLGAPQASGHAEGVVTGISDSGSYVYFVADGVLAEHAPPGHCAVATQPAGATCNLYVAHLSGQHKWSEHNWQTDYVASLSVEDAPDWQAPQANLRSLTARVSQPSGRYLAFMSERSLTGYDNRDANSGQPDEEVFLYDAVAKRLTCASCNPTGARPVGVFDPDRGEREATSSMLVDFPEIWPKRWLAANIPGWTTKDGASAIYQSRYLSDQGRLFFNSPDELVHDPNHPELASNGKENVYEYEPEGVGGCHSSHCLSLISSGTSRQESAFLDASATGDDVYFLTAQQLVGADQDTTFDVYDAHVCSAALPCITILVPKPEPCESVEQAPPCRSPATPPPTFAPPSSITSGPSNPPPNEEKLQQIEVKHSVHRQPTRAQLLAAALKKCQRKYAHSRQKRTTCERQARKKYAAKKTSRHRKGAKK